MEMEPIVASVTRLRRLEIRGFYERKRWGELTGTGYFFTPEYLERWQPSSISMLVSSSVPGITSTPAQSTLERRVLRSAVPDEVLPRRD